MNISIRSKNMLFFILLSLGGLLVNTPVLRAASETMAPQEATEVQLSPEEIDSITRALAIINTSIKTNLDELISNINSVLLGVKNDNIKTTDKSRFQENGLDLINNLNDLREKTSLEVDLNVMYTLQFCITEIAHHLDKALKSTKIVD